MKHILSAECLTLFWHHSTFTLNEPFNPLHCACDCSLLNTQQKITFQKVKNDSHCGIMFYAGAESVTITEDEGASKERKKGNYMLFK